MSFFEMFKKKSKKENSNNVQSLDKTQRSESPKRVPPINIASYDDIPDETFASDFDSSTEEFQKHLDDLSSQAKKAESLEDVLANEPVKSSVKLSKKKSKNKKSLPKKTASKKSDVSITSPSTKDSTDATKEMDVEAEMEAFFAEDSLKEATKEKPSSPLRKPTPPKSEANSKVASSAPSKKEEKPTEKSVDKQVEKSVEKSVKPVEPVDKAQQNPLEKVEEKVVEKKMEKKEKKKSFFSFHKKEKSKTPSPETKPPVSFDELVIAIREYYLINMKKGFSKKEISEFLLQKSYPAEAVVKASQDIAPKPSAKT